MHATASLSHEKFNHVLFKKWIKFVHARFIRLNLFLF